MTVKIASASHMTFGRCDLGISNLQRFLLVEMTLKWNISLNATIYDTALYAK